MPETDTRALRIAVAGAAGRMGRRLVALIHEDATLRLASALEHESSPHVGADAGELAGVGRIGAAVAPSLIGTADVLVDFSTPAGVTHWLRACVETGTPYVTGVTGLSAEQDAQLDAAARRIAVLAAPNMSLGVNLLLRLVEQAARVLRDYDAEIIEAHHRFKKDAPSGTALALCRALQAGSDPPRDEVVHGRVGGDLSRPSRQIGVHALRAGDIIGRHDVIFSGLGETLTFSHAAHSRDTFVRGALLAARWIVGRPSGRYMMQDVLFSPPR